MKLDPKNFLSIAPFLGNLFPDLLYDSFESDISSRRTFVEVVSANPTYIPVVTAVVFQPFIARVAQQVSRVAIENNIAVQLKQALEALEFFHAVFQFIQIRGSSFSD